MLSQVFKAALMRYFFSFSVISEFGSWINAGENLLSYGGILFLDPDLERIPLL